MEKISLETETLPNAISENFFTGSVPRNYDTYMGPMLLKPFALDIDSRIREGGSIKVLELASGTGQVTRCLINTLPDATIIATDISEDMIAVGKEIIHSSKLDWQNVNMASIPFEDNCFDLIICQFGLMFVPDKPGALTEIRRVLKPGGQFLFNTWGKMEENPVWHISMNLFATAIGGGAAPNGQGPFGLTDAEEVMNLLEYTKFKNITCQTVYKTTEIETAEIAATGFTMTQPSLSQNHQLFTETKTTLQKELARKLGDHPMRSQLLALVFDATK